LKDNDLLPGSPNGYQLIMVTVLHDAIALLSR
jgi:hypothetical protein